MQPKFSQLSIDQAYRNDQRIEIAFDKCDADKDGRLDRIEARELFSQVFKFKNGAEMTDELFEIIFGTIDADNSDKLEKTEVMAYCLQVKAGESAFLTQRLAMFAEPTEENQRAIAKAQMEQTFG